MANEEHLSILRQGTDTWNRWRENLRDENPDLSGANLSDAAHFESAKPDLRGANLAGADLSHAFIPQANLSYADLTGANLTGACLVRANLNFAALSRVNLTGADLTEARLFRVNLTGRAILETTVLHGADLRGANLSQGRLARSSLRGANLSGANLSGTNLVNANLVGATLVETSFSGAILSGANLCEANAVRADFTGADLNDCHVFGISAWDVQLQDAKQSRLVITRDGEYRITVDNLAVAQLIHLLLMSREKLRDVINTLTSKVVLILGRFTPERKVVMDAMAGALRNYNLLPIIFDFEQPAARELFGDDSDTSWNVPLRDRGYHKSKVRPSRITVVGT